jgi:hypothetical protein
MSADPWSRPIPNQGHTPDCTRWAVAGACAITSSEGVDYSAQFIGFEGNRQIGEIGVPDHGQSVRTLLSALHRIGICSEALCRPDWPNDKQPNPDAYADAEQRIGWWEFEQFSDGFLNTEEKENENIVSALSRPNTVVLISHWIDARWPTAKAGDVLGYTGGEVAHTGILCGVENGLYRYRATAGEQWADRGTILVRPDIVASNFAIWRVSYIGPIR